MRFRPCIDIHNGKVKQIVGGSLRDEGDCASENFVSGQDAAWYARFYQQDHLRGGHIILLNAADSPEYAGTLRQAKEAFEKGETDVDTLKRLVTGRIEAEPLASIDYVELFSFPALQPIRKVSERALLAIAVKIGKTRLIDNVILEGGLKSS